jgi:hypothetical protein
VLLLADKEKASNINFQANTGTVLFPFQHFAEKQIKNTYLKKKISMDFGLPLTFYSLLASCLSH